MLRSALLAFLALAGPFGLAQVVTSDAAGKAADNRPFYSRIPGMFPFDLPEIDPPGTVKLIIHPRFADLLRRDYIRVDAGFRWAISNRFEFSPEARFYLTHGLGDTDDGYGVGEIRLGTKYVLPKWPSDAMETSLTLAAYVPIKDAPVDLTDGFNHLTPGFVMQRHLIRHPKWTVFGGAGMDLIDQSDVAGTPYFNQPLEDSMNFTVGAIYDLGQIKWTLSTTYATTAWLGDETNHFLNVMPNVMWYVPKKWMRFSKTQWILVLGARVSFGPDGTEISTSSRVRAEITFRQVMDKFRKKPAEPGAR
jgi:hypothetical protein